MQCIDKGKMHCEDDKLFEPLMSDFPGTKEQHAKKSEYTLKINKRIRQCHSAPAPELTDSCPKEKLGHAAPEHNNFGNRDSKSTSWKGFLIFIAYLGIGTVCFFAMEHELQGEATHGLIDALYLCIVTMTTVGYGDLVPDGISAKLFTCVFVFVGFGLVGLLLGTGADFLFEKQETMLMKALSRKQSSGDTRGLQEQIIRIRWKVVIAGTVVLVLSIIGLIFLIIAEGMNFLDAFYCVCTTVTTLGYGDVSFHTIGGRSFAVIWILVSTISVAQFFLYVTELYTEGRRQSFLHWVLTRKTTSADLEASDMDNDGVVSASEFVLYKLKELGKIEEQDIAEILEEFYTLDVDHSGTLTTYDLKLAQGAES